VFDSREGSSLTFALFFLATQPQRRLYFFLGERKGMRPHKTSLFCLGTLIAMGRNDIVLYFKARTD
jgi:hypothetical protein